MGIKGHRRLDDSRVADWARMALLLVAMAFSGCATGEPPPGTPKIAGLSRPAAGSSWIISDKNSGSYGSTTDKSTIRSEGEREFQGKEYGAYSRNGNEVSYYDPEGRFVGQTRDGKVTQTQDPGFQSFGWPLHVGRSWMHTFRFTDHAAGRTFDNVQWWSKVEAYEDVTTPVGTLKAFRILHDNASLKVTNWWSPDLGITVKSRAERKGNFYAGPGVRETELVSHEIKR